MSQLPTTTANLSIELLVSCPYCESFLDIFHLVNVQDALDDTHLKNCNLEIECQECLEKFLVTDINF